MGAVRTFRNSFNWEQQPVAIVSVFPRRETHFVLVLRLAYPCYKCVFDFSVNPWLVATLGWRWLLSEDLSGVGGSARGGDVVALAVEVMLDEDRWWMVVDSDGMRNGRRWKQKLEQLW